MHTVYGDDLYFFTFCTTRKVTEIDSNPRVEVVWCKLQEQSQVSRVGRLWGYLYLDLGRSIVDKKRAVPE
jgi:general stress protein 26